MSMYAFMILIAALLIIVTGIFCLIYTRNIIRVIIGIEIAMKAVTLVLALAGWINGMYALVQSFIITMIVVEVVVAVVAAGLAISIYRKTGSLDTRKINNLKG
ncbi:MAG: NADH-quinone oxidoreductase subunit K [Bacillota bacterium]|jgi:NADH-quinone oxidoreductase subunit K